MKSSDLLKNKEQYMKDIIKEKEIEKGGSTLSYLRARKNILLFYITSSMVLVTALLIIYRAIGYSE